MSDILELKKVSRMFSGPDGTVEALSDISLTVSSGEFVTVRGPSGCGKTTLLLLAGSLLKPSSGEVIIDGMKPYEMSANRRSRMRTGTIGFVFQQFHLVPYLTVIENILTPSVALRMDDSHERAEELVSHFGIDHRRRHLPEQLSTGERQRTALARALLNRPSLLLADEPTGNLDEESGKTVLDALAEFAHDGGAVMMVTHDSKGIEAGDRDLALKDGRLSDS